MLRRRAFAEIHFRYALACGARPPFARIVCCGLIGCRMRRATSVKRGARVAIMGGVSFAELCYFVWGRMVLCAKRKIATVLP